jgi:demethylmenaquinone methyltransferase/2-methoxy-6-polyprenyl-1,4-benzoquinol methylase
MFDRIAGRYDFLNRLLSLRRDVAWRKALARALPDEQRLRILDVATGTGDVLLAMKRTGRLAYGLGLDVSGNMLTIAQQKLGTNNGVPSAALMRGDAMAMPLADASFDVCTTAFGIRNVPDVAAALHEMRRVLRTGGRLLVLEFSLPANRVLRGLYLWYFRNILPLLGGLISGDSGAYRYLNETAEAFPHGAAFCERLEAAGFANVRAKPLTFGIATLYQGER